jgi:hypothetical protein
MAAAIFAQVSKITQPIQIKSAGTPCGDYLDLSQEFPPPRAAVPKGVANQVFAVHPSLLTGASSVNTNGANNAELARDVVGMASKSAQILESDGDDVVIVADHQGALLHFILHT